ncbi:hypothetical protein F2P56_029090 [Juglans regia]|uniref:BZIP domain-containing protein n=2 Tax=Juglans regia TaxID=51240 RepID=A0A833X871_JUGRE|nr:bZIP transcription factor 12-like [Juglans regia]KAF5448570.1 hypothetical protein F2P56_029090 [Juglans regia]
MASSKLVTTNPDLPRQSSLCSLSTILADLQQQQHQQNPSSSSKALVASMSMDDLLKNLYSDQTPNQLPLDGSSSISPQRSFSQPKELGDKTVEDVWKEIVAGNDNQRQAGAEEAGNDAASGQLEEMTLEDFLTKAGAVREEDVRRGAVVPGPGGYGVDSSASVAMNGGQFALQGVEVGHAMVPFDGRVVVGGAVGGGRGKRRAVEEPVVDKATQQRQRRMIKNRESAARSRERKQAYTVELESLVTQLEEENARLLREEAYQSKERFKQLMQNLVPVVEKRRPPRTLRRVHSVHW